MTSTAFAADISTATLQLSGNVPTVFSVTARGYPGEIDLAPGTTVVNRLMGILHFRYNVEIASLTFLSSTASGTIENAAGTAFAWATGGGLKSAAPACTVLDGGLGKLDGAVLDMNPAVSVLAAAAPDMLEADCPLTSSWTTSAGLQASGLYSMTVTAVMTSI
ncbi:MAG: hypothetical protein A2X94_08505 [Bdellovibrionales bacterium GWB1_55_8]|nr:MAG: hypothetical protein A2X94_08505 [Bdellovibrionales bacterium GWB1_55_8]